METLRLRSGGARVPSQPAPDRRSLFLPPSQLLPLGLLVLLQQLSLRGAPRSSRHGFRHKHRKRDRPKSSPQGLLQA